VEKKKRKKPLNHTLKTTKEMDFKKEKCNE
jgi:hypothetical protein